MSAIPVCMENIVGLSRTDCECVEARPVDAGVSASGLYIDELDGMTIRMADAKRDCGEDGLWTMMARARGNAIEDTQTDLVAGVAEKTDLARQAGPSQIGDDKKATGDSVKLRHAVHGLTLQLAKVRGGVFRVKAIGTAFKTSGTVVVDVWDRYTETPIASYTIVHQGNRLHFTDLPVPLELPMSYMGTQPSRYWFTFTPTTDLKALNVLVNCGCGGFEPYWNFDNPQYDSPSQKAGKSWADWCMACGTYGEDMVDRNTWVTGINTTQGLALQVEMDCDQMSAFCPDVPNYRTDNVQKVLAHAVRYRAGISLITNILTSTNINRYTMTAGEVLEQLRGRYQKEYDARIGWLVEQLVLPQNVNRYGDCFRCRDQWGMAVSLIRS